MKFRIDKHTQNELLIRELKEYESVTEMTKDECVALRRWVTDGNSVYENSSCYSQENGMPMAFLESYRYNQDALQALERGEKRHE